MGFWISRMSDHCASVPDRWAKQYSWSGDTRKDEIGEKLKALPASDLRPEIIDEIIGNDSWTIHRCDECDEQFEYLVGIDSTGMLFCEECLSKALGKIRSRGAELIMSANDAYDEINRLRAQVDEWENRANWYQYSLEVVAGRRQSIDKLLSNEGIAKMALDYPPWSVRERGCGLSEGEEK